MDTLTWLGQEIIAYFIANRVVSFLTLTIGSGVIFGMLKKWWEPVAVPVFYAIVSGGVIFICMWLLTQSDRQFTNGKPPRPYFTQAQAKIHSHSQGIRILTVSVQNNDTPAQNVVSQFLVLQEFLDPTIGPLHSRTVESANPVGSRGIFSQHWWPVGVKPNTRPAFVVFQIRYSNILSEEVFSQAFFLKFLGVSQDGTFIQELINASSYEKTRIEKYMKERGIPIL